MNTNVIIFKINDLINEDITVKSRRVPVVLGRMIAMQLMREQRMTLEDIGKTFNLDHSTVCHHLKKFNHEVKYNDDVFAIYNKLHIPVAEKTIYEMNRLELISIIEDYRKKENHGNN